MKITWLGTASVRIETECGRILFDPYVQLNGGENPNSFEDFVEDQDIFITHGHLDHLVDAAEFLEADGEPEAAERCPEGWRSPEATIYCGSVAAEILAAAVTDMSNVVEVKPKNVLSVGDISVKVWEGRHADPGLLKKLSVLFSARTLKYWKNALALAYLNKHFQEKGQTFAYEVQAEGKRVFLMGSLGLAEDVEYPTGADLLVLPFQGSRKLEETALGIVERLQPKRVMLDHFDDAFPPVSESVDTRLFKKRMDERFPQIPVVKPVYKKTVEL